MSNYRIESDSFGELKIPKDKYWGAQTQRSILAFQQAGKNNLFQLLNHQVLLKLLVQKLILNKAVDPTIGEAIIKASLEVVDGKFRSLSLGYLANQSGINRI